MMALYFYLCFLVFAFVGATADAATYFVGKNVSGASNSHGCTNATSDICSTVTKGISLLAPGDTLLVRTGTYTELLDLRNITFPNGTPGNLITLAAYRSDYSPASPCITAGLKGPGGGCDAVTLTNSTVDGVLVMPNFWIVDGFIIDATNALYGIDAGNNSIYKNLDISGSGKNVPGTGARDGMGIIMQPAQPTPHGNNQVLNVHIHDLSLASSPTEAGLGSHGCYCESDNNIIDGSEFGPGIGQLGIQLYPSASNNIVRNSIIHDTGLGIDIYHGGGGLQGGGITIYGNNNQILNNLFYNNQKAIAWQPFGAHTINNNTTYHNTVSALEGSGGGHTIRNNILSGLGSSNGIFLDDGAMFSDSNVFSNNLCDSAQAHCDFAEVAATTFVTPGTDFHLKLGSAAIDHGTNTGCPSPDIVGTPRPQNSTCDIGAYEFASAALPPVITINKPATCVGTSSACTTSSASITVTGTSTQTGGSVLYDNDRTPATGLSTTGTVSSWSTGSIILKSGKQDILVKGTDSLGNLGTNQITITYAPTFPGNTLAGAWALNDGSGGTAADSSGNINNGSLINGATWVSGKFSTGVSFNSGSLQYINVADTPSLDFTQGFTFSLWLQLPTSHTDFRAAIVKNYMIALYASVSGYCGNGNPIIFIQTNGILGPPYSACGPTPLPTGTPVHLAGTYDLQTLRLFVNGVQVASVGATGYMEPSALPLQIGSTQAIGFGEYLDATFVDEVRVYNYALPVSALSNVTPGVTCTPQNFIDNTQGTGTPSIIGNMNCPIIQGTPPILIKFPASATGLKAAAAAAGLKFGSH